MSNVKVKLDDAGIQELLKGKEMREILASYGRQKANEAGAGYDSDVHVYSKRAVANVFPNTKEAAQDNYENNTLLKVVK